MTSVSIPGWSVNAQGTVIYLIALSKNEVEWSTKRRYKEFVSLHQVVRRHLAPDILPELPPKQMMRIGLKKHIEPEFLESRRVKLESYLQTVLQHVEPERVEALDDFLEWTQHALEAYIRRLSEMQELQQIVRLLRQAADNAGQVHIHRASEDFSASSATGMRSTSSGGGGGGGRGGLVGSPGKRLGSPDDSGALNRSGHGGGGDDDDNSTVVSSIGPLHNVGNSNNAGLSGVSNNSSTNSSGGGGGHGSGSSEGGSLIKTSSSGGGFSSNRAVSTSGAGAGAGAVVTTAAATATDALAFGAADGSGGLGDSLAAAAAGSGGDLLAQLSEVVRMLLDFLGLLRSNTEDREEQAGAAVTNSIILAAQLRAKREDAADERQVMEALRAARAKECEKERAALLLVAAQLRTVVAEVVRVQADCSVLRRLQSRHNACYQLFSAAVIPWHAASFSLASAPLRLLPSSSSSSSSSTASTPLQAALRAWLEGGKDRLLRLEDEEEAEKDKDGSDKTTAAAEPLFRSLVKRRCALQLGADASSSSSSSNSEALALFTGMRRRPELQSQSRQLADAVRATRRVQSAIDTVCSRIGEVAWPSPDECEGLTTTMTNANANAPSAAVALGHTESSKNASSRIGRRSASGSGASVAASASSSSSIRRSVEDAAEDAVAIASIHQSCGRLLDRSCVSGINEHAATLLANISTANAQLLSLLAGVAHRSVAPMTTTMTMQVQAASRGTALTSAAGTPLLSPAGNVLVPRGCDPVSAANAAAVILSSSNNNSNHHQLQHYSGGGGGGSDRQLQLGSRDYEDGTSAGGRQHLSSSVVDRFGQNSRQSSQATVFGGVQGVNSASSSSSSASASGGRGDAAATASTANGRSGAIAINQNNSYSSNTHNANAGPSSFNNNTSFGSVSGSLGGGGVGAGARVGSLSVGGGGGMNGGGGVPYSLMSEPAAIPHIGSYGNNNYNNSNGMSMGTSPVRPQSTSLSNQQQQQQQQQQQPGGYVAASVRYGGGNKRPGGLGAEASSTNLRMANNADNYSSTNGNGIAFSPSSASSIGLSSQMATVAAGSSNTTAAALALAGGSAMSTIASPTHGSSSVVVVNNSSNSNSNAGRGASPKKLLPPSGATGAASTPGNPFGAARSPPPPPPHPNPTTTNPFDNFSPQQQQQQASAAAGGSSSSYEGPQRGVSLLHQAHAHVGARSISTANPAVAVAAAGPRGPAGLLSANYSAQSFAGVVGRGGGGGGGNPFGSGPMSTRPLSAALAPSASAAAAAAASSTNPFGPGMPIVRSATTVGMSYQPPVSASGSGSAGRTPGRSPGNPFG